MSMRDEGHRQQRFLPYASLRGASLIGEPELVVDGKPREEGIDTDKALVSLDDDDWKVAVLRWPVVVASEELLPVVPDDEAAEPPVNVVVLVRCPATRLRRAVMAEGGAVQITIAREDVRDAVHFTPLLMRTTTRDQPTPGFASRAGVRLGQGRAWDLRVDPKTPKAGQFLDVRYRRFSDDALLAPLGDTLYHLEVDQPEPILWINADHERLVPVLDAKGSTGKQARMREVCFDLITHGVWVQLFVRAADDLTHGGELTYPWQDTALRELLPLVFPEERGHTARLDTLQRVLAADGLAGVMPRLDPALQRKMELSRHLVRLVDEVGT